jgi:uncharacterized repeat protein (TIGR03803 family)
MAPPDEWDRARGRLAARCLAHDISRRDWALHTRRGRLAGARGHRVMFGWARIAIRRILSPMDLRLRLFVAISLLIAIDAVAQTTLYEFESPAEAWSSLVDGGDGYYYGTTARGGPAGKGDVYKVDLATGIRTSLASFNDANGSYPYADLAVTPLFLYGTTYLGGANFAGTLFRVDRRTNEFSILHTFGGASSRSPAYPLGGVVVVGDDLYGTTQEGGDRNPQGAIYTYSVATGQLTTLFSFDSYGGNGPGRGAAPIGSMVLRGSALYGATKYAAYGASGTSVLFKFDLTTGQYTPYPPMRGSSNTRPLVAGDQVYATTSTSSAEGFVQRLDIATGTVTEINNLTFATTGVAYGPLSTDGTYLYGTTSYVDSTGHPGSVFRIDPVTLEWTTLARFDYANGAFPKSGLILRSGALYGTTAGGGPNSGGVIFRLDLSSNALSTVTTFNSVSTGATPSAGLMLDGRYLYGASYDGGTYGLGTVYRYDLTSGQLEGLASMDYSTGGNSRSTLVMHSGKLYGTTQRRGPANNGSIFVFDPITRSIAPAVGFSPFNTSGLAPAAGLTAVDSVLYGTAPQGAQSIGTVFRFDPASAELSTVYRFVQPPTNGMNPQSPLLLYNGMLYGTTYQGGTRGSGSVYRIDPTTGAFSTVASVDRFATNGGFYVTSGLAAVGGFLYGATVEGGGIGQGTLFRVNPATGEYVTVAPFDPSRGSYPYGDVATDGVSIFGTTIRGGAANRGTLYRFDPARNSLSAIVNFDIANGDSPIGALLVRDGFIYGTTRYGGSKGGGTLFRIPIPRPRQRSVSK